MDDWEQTGECNSRDEDGSLWANISYRRDLGAGECEVRTERVLLEAAAPAAEV